MSPWSPFIFTACEHYLQTAQKLLVKLQAMITDGNSGLLSCLPHINATLMKLVYTCDGASKMETMTTSFEVKENVAPGKKMELQPRFTATTNTPERKQRKNILQYVNSFFAFSIHNSFTPQLLWYVPYSFQETCQHAYFPKI